MKLNTLELFSGTKSFSKVMSSHGHDTTTIDIDANLNPDYCIDVLKLDSRLLGLMHIPLDILWASPPCEGFSVAVIGRNWNHDHTPKTDSARMAIRVAQKTIDIIEAAKPRFWFIENPRGKLRKMPFMAEFLERTGGVHHQISYCQYGDTRMKPTDIWTNALWWKPRPICRNGMPCHESAPRGARTGTQGIKGARDRGAIPPQVFEDMLKQFKQVSYDEMNEVEERNDGPL